MVATQDEDLSSFTGVLWTLIRQTTGVVPTQRSVSSQPSCGPEGGEDTTEEDASIEDEMPIHEHECKLQINEFEERLQKEKKGHSSSSKTFKWSPEADSVVKLSKGKEAVTERRVFDLLRTLDLQASGVKILDKRVKRLRNLTALDLSENNLSTVSYLPPKAELLDLYSNEICSWQVTERMDNVKHLGLGYNVLKDSLNFVKGLPNLLSLDLAHNDLCHLPNTLSTLEALKHLRQLYLYGNPFCLQPWYRAKSIRHLAGITTLDDLGVTPAERVAAQALNLPGGQEHVHLVLSLTFPPEAVAALLLEPNGHSFVSLQIDWSYHERLDNFSGADKLTGTLGAIKRPEQGQTDSVQVILLEREANVSTRDAFFWTGGLVLDLFGMGRVAKPVEPAEAVGETSSGDGVVDPPAPAPVEEISHLSKEKRLLYRRRIRLSQFLNSPNNLAQELSDTLFFGADSSPSRLVTSRKSQEPRLLVSLNPKKCEKSPA